MTSDFFTEKELQKSLGMTPWGPSYGALNNPDAIYLTGAPDDQEERLRARGAISHLEHTGAEPTIYAPEDEMDELEDLYGEFISERGIDTVTLENQPSTRREDFQILDDYLEGDEEVHVFSSDYTSTKDRILSRGVLGMGGYLDSGNLEVFGLDTEMNRFNKTLSYPLQTGHGLLNWGRSLF